MSRRTMFYTGIVALVLAVAGLAVALLWETNFSSTLTKVNPTWWDRTVWIGHGIDAQIAIYSIAMLVGAIIVPLGAFIYGVGRNFLGLAAMWLGALVLAVGAILDLPAWSQISLSGVTGWNQWGLGIFLLPAAIVSVLAAIGDSLPRPQLHGRRVVPQA